MSAQSVVEPQVEPQAGTPGPRQGAGSPPATLPAVPAASPLDLPAEQFQAGLQRRKSNRGALMAWIREALVAGVDYGRIHVVGRDKCPHGRQCRNPGHFSKPSLFKPGAEKICGMLGVCVSYPTLSDYEQAALHGVALVHVIIRCELRDAAGHAVADGVGARSLRQDSGDLNKSLKMAEKSAHIDATLRMAGLSEVFTQDLEDMTHGQNLEEAPGNPGAHTSQDRAARQAARGAPSRQSEGGITEAQLKRLQARISRYRLDPRRVQAWVARASGGRVQSLEQLTPALYQRLDRRLPQFANQAGGV